MDGELSFKNLTDTGKGVINTMLVMKKWYNGEIFFENLKIWRFSDHAKMLENLADQSKQLLKAKNAVLGSGERLDDFWWILAIDLGSERGVNHRLKQLTIDIAKTREGALSIRLFSTNWWALISELLIHEKSDWNTQFDTMSEEFKLTNKLVEDYVSINPCWENHQFIAYFNLKSVFSWVIFKMQKEIYRLWMRN